MKFLLYVLLTTFMVIFTGCSEVIDSSNSPRDTSKNIRNIMEKYKEQYDFIKSQPRARKIESFFLSVNGYRTKLECDAIFVYFGGEGGLLISLHERFEEEGLPIWSTEENTPVLRARASNVFSVGLDSKRSLSLPENIDLAAYALSDDGSSFKIDFDSIFFELRDDAGLSLSFPTQLKWYGISIKSSWKSSSPGSAIVPRPVIRASAANVIFIGLDPVVREGLYKK
jgi:hypothetical protein